MLQIRPDTAEAVSIAIAGELSAATGCRFHVVHTASARGIQAVRRAQCGGRPADGRDVPALPGVHRRRLRRAGRDDEGVSADPRGGGPGGAVAGGRDGTIASIGSDHAPHTRAEKSLGLALGAGRRRWRRDTGAGAGRRDAATAGWRAERLAWVLSEDTARLYGLYPRKGALAGGRRRGLHADRSRGDDDGRRGAAALEGAPERVARPPACAGRSTTTVLRGRGHRPSRRTDAASRAGRLVRARHVPR